MSRRVTITVDGHEIEAKTEQSILEACDAAGIYVPRLCWLEGLRPAGACRVCTVRVDGRAQAACTQPVAEGMTVENDTAELRGMRRDLIDMMFVEGNHFCMVCERSGACELQALAYRFGITAPRYPFAFPVRDLDASHPDLFLDRNRCILCGRCVRASAQLDGKAAVGFSGRGADKRLIASSAEGLGGTDLSLGDEAASVCPTGALVRKRNAFVVPVGQRPFDRVPIGSEIEARGKQERER